MSPSCPPSVPFLLLFTVNMGAAGVYTGKEKREQNERSSCFSLRSRLKILLLFARYPSRLLRVLFSALSFSLPLFHFVPSSSLFLDLRSTRFTSLAVQSTPSVPRLHPNHRSLAINKKRKKKEKITRTARARARRGCLGCRIIRNGPLGSSAKEEADIAQTFSISRGSLLKSDFNSVLSSFQLHFS